jgi:hypothetical protein
MPSATAGIGLGGTVALLEIPIATEAGAVPALIDRLKIFPPTPCAIVDWYTPHAAVVPEDAVVLAVVVAVNELVPPVFTAATWKS